MIPTQFNKGNFNQFETLIKTTIPLKLRMIRREIIPAIDRVLRSMLGENTKVEKESINITQKYTEDTGLFALECTLVYNCFDFLVPHAPEKAIEEDTKNMKDYLFIKDTELKELTIDVKTGYLTIVYSIPVDRR